MVYKPSSIRHRSAHGFTRQKQTVDHALDTRTRELEAALRHEREVRNGLEERVADSDNVLKQDVELFRDIQQEALLDRELRMHLQDRISDLATLGERCHKARTRALSDSGIPLEELEQSRNPKLDKANASAYEQIEYYFLSAEQAFHALHDISLFRKHKLLSEESMKAQQEGYRLIKASQDMMANVNELGRKLVANKTIKVKEFGKRPYWGGELVCLNETLQKFGGCINAFSEQLRTLDRATQVSKFGKKWQYDHTIRPDLEPNHPVEDACLSAMRMTNNRGQRRTHEILTDPKENRNEEKVATVSMRVNPELEFPGVEENMVNQLTSTQDPLDPLMISHSVNKSIRYPVGSPHNERMPSPHGKPHSLVTDFDMDALGASSRNQDALSGSKLEFTRPNPNSPFNPHWDVLNGSKRSVSGTKYELSGKVSLSYPRSLGNLFAPSTRMGTGVPDGTTSSANFSLGSANLGSKSLKDLHSSSLIQGGSIVDDPQAPMYTATRSYASMPAASFAALERPDHRMNEFLTRSQVSSESNAKPFRSAFFYPESRPDVGNDRLEIPFHVGESPRSPTRSIRQFRNECAEDQERLDRSLNRLDRSTNRDPFELSTTSIDGFPPEQSKGFGNPCESSGRDMSGQLHKQSYDTKNYESVSLDLKMKRASLLRDDRFDPLTTTQYTKYSGCLPNSTNEAEGFLGKGGDASGLRKPFTGTSQLTQERQNLKRLESNRSQITNVMNQIGKTIRPAIGTLKFDSTNTDKKQQLLRKSRF